MTSITNLIKGAAQIDILKKGREQENFVGRPFYIDYNKVLILTCDAWKAQVNGVPQGAFLLAFYDGEADVEEALLLRAIAPTKLPTDDDNIKSMVAYYKDNMDIAGRAGVESSSSQLDQFTRYEFSFSGLECSILGVFYRVNESDEGGKVIKKTEFGADVENFYSSNNYKVYKATSDVLQTIVNQRDSEAIAGGDNEFRIGNVRYSSSRRFQKGLDDVPVWISPDDFLGKRTALFGMTRTGKSNTVKKIIQATVEISSRAKRILANDISQIERIRTQLKNDKSGNNQLQQQEQEFIKGLPKPFLDGSPKYPVGQIIFDINGEYANANMQDEGTAIFEIYEKQVIRFSVLPKDGFEVMKVNFYKDYEAGFELVTKYFRAKKENVDYLNNFLAINLEKPEDYDTDRSVKTRYDRLLAAYLCCLKRAGFAVPDNFTVKYEGHASLNALSSITPNSTRGITLDEAASWFSAVWREYDSEPYLTGYPRTHQGREWASEDLKAVLAFLTRQKTPGAANLVSGFRKLKDKRLLDLHTELSERPFESVIIEALRLGRIVIVDLSQGDPEIQKIYSDKICQNIFSDSMSNFIDNNPNNFIQFYFEEAHNLFPKKEDKDLSDIYNRIAKEGAKLNLGMIYATQEVSSISGNILKNTQNWFIAHLNNEDELKEIKKYYDFSDFTSSLIRFSATNDKGFVRMKTYTNPFVVPVQIDRFLADKAK